MTINVGQVTVNIYTTQNQPVQVLDEYTQGLEKQPVRLVDKVAGKSRPWRGKKVGTIKLSKALNNLGQHKKANRVWWCGVELEFAEDLATGKKKLKSARFCRERLCIMCSWRRSIKMFNQLSQVLDVAQEEHPDTALLFLTLTVKNCFGKELQPLLDDMFKGWARLTEHRRVRGALKGWFRALEVTYNKEKDTYHPHFHAVLMVDKSYFFNEKTYMTTEKWVHIWRTSCRLDYDPICDIRAVRTKADDRDRQRVQVAEFTKYTVKEADILHGDEETTEKVVEVLGTSLRGRRLHAYGGILKIIAKRLKFDDKKDENLVVLDEADTVRSDVANLIAIYQWDYGLSDYFLHSRK